LKNQYKALINQPLEIFQKVEAKKDIEKVEAKLFDIETGKVASVPKPTELVATGYREIPQDQEDEQSGVSAGRATSEERRLAEEGVTAKNRPVETSISCGKRPRSHCWRARSLPSNDNVAVQELVRDRPAVPEVLLIYLNLQCSQSFRWRRSSAPLLEQFLSSLTCQTLVHADFPTADLVKFRVPKLRASTESKT
jgi:hypothetical protein